MTTYPKYWNEKMETMDPGRLKKIQEEKLQKQIKYVYENSPFYTEKMEQNGLKPKDIQTIEDLSRFPFTTKYEIRESLQAAPPLGKHAACDLEKVVRIVSSTGTTGSPSYVGITKHDNDNWLEIVARTQWAQGVRPNSKFINAFGLGFFVGGLPLKDAIEMIGATNIPIGTGASDRIITVAQWLGADWLGCTPSYAIYLAEYTQKKMGIDPRRLSIRRISSGAEPGAGVPEVRKKIDELWNGKISEGLGNADMGPILFGECEEREGMHFCAQEFVIPEVIDPDTGQVLALKDGLEGELVYTAIDRECCPLIRFRTRDRIVVWTSPCACGRTSFRMRCIGRTDDMLIILGVNVFPSAVKDVVMSMRPETTGEIQILLDKSGPKVDPPLKIQVEYAKGVADLEKLKKEVQELLRDKLIFQSEVLLVPEGTLPRFEMKAQLTKKLYE